MGPLFSPPCSVARGNIDLPDDSFRLGPDEIDRKKSVGQVGAEDVHALGQKEGALELPGGDAAMQIGALPVVLLAPADHELVFLQRDLELVARETGHRQRDAQAIGLVLARAGETLDIVGRIAVAGGARDPVERTLDRLEPQQERGIQW